MGQLQRIILINTHLEGVVELTLSGHTNICGTNASGKTTLQRLIPVFYGELPNKVVPKTRKKFDQFYLPSSNSYLVYEYQRANGEYCQAVLTRCLEGGVEYRFVAAAYAPEQYLRMQQDQAQALSYQEFASQLRQRDLRHSRKLQATTEYRSVILNDASAGRGQDSLSLRQMASQYSLVQPQHRIRHMEKLVSAVHAKEGKLDTLKTMLAAIFEDDGVELPSTRIQSSKVRDWLNEMRQSMQLEQLEQSHQDLHQLSQQLDGLEQQLWQLRPRLEDDKQQLSRERADAQQEVQQKTLQLEQAKQEHEQQLDQQHAKLSQSQADLRVCQKRLDHLQQQYDRYLDDDLAALERDSQQLPHQRQQLTQLDEQYRLLAEQHADLARVLELRKFDLQDQYQRLSEQTQQQSKGLHQQKDRLREQQADQRQQLEQDFEQARQAMQARSQQQQAELNEKIALAKGRLGAHPLTQEEQERLNLAHKRIEQAQSQAQQQSRLLAQQLEQHHQAQQRQQEQDLRLRALRQQQSDQAQAHQQLLEQQSPDPQSLRHFVRQQLPGWEHQLGKLIRPELLSRHDLKPALDSQSQHGAFGLALNLSGLPLPEHALDELAITQALAHSQSQIQKLELQQQQIEKQLQEANDQVGLQMRQVQQARLQLQQGEQDVSYAVDAKQRLQSELEQLQRERRGQLKAQLQTNQDQLQELQQQSQQSLAELKHQQGAQMLEHKANWQEQLGDLDEQLQQQEQLLRRQKDHNEQLLAQLEAAFNDELAAKGIDPKQLQSLQAERQQLKRWIQSTESRQDELRNYQSFMQQEWQQQRPELLRQEHQLEQQQSQLERDLTQLTSRYQEQRRHGQAQLKACQLRQQQLDHQLDELQPLLKRLSKAPMPRLELATAPRPLAETDLQERMARCSEALEQQALAHEQLKQGVERLQQELSKNASLEFLERLEEAKRQLPEPLDQRMLMPIFDDMLSVLRSKREMLLAGGRNFGSDLQKFFTVFRDLNRRIQEQSRRLSEAVSDDLVLDGILRAEVRIESTITDLGFWQPLSQFAKLYQDWQQEGPGQLPSSDYLNALADVVDLLRADDSYTFESLMRLELHLNEGGTDLIIRNDRQLLESSSHGMAYLILCKFLLAFTRLLRGPAEVKIHWPIDEIGTLAYHNVEKLFHACNGHQIVIVGAFPNPESDVLSLFQQRYLIEPCSSEPHKRLLKRIEPKLSRLSQRLSSETQLEASL